MTNLQLTIDADRLLQALNKAPLALQSQLGDDIHTIINHIARDAREFAPKGGTSLLTNSINAMMIGPLEGVVTPGVDYARFVEEDTDPHFPNVQNIQDWVHQVKLSPAHPGDSERDVAFRIARAIAVRGTPKQPFMGPALEKNREPADRRISATLDRILGLAA